MAYEEIKRRLTKILLTGTIIGASSLYVLNSIKEDDSAELKDNVVFYSDNEPYLAHINKKFNRDEVQLSFFSPAVSFSDFPPLRGVNYKSNFDFPNTDQNSWTLEERLQFPGGGNPTRTNKESPDYILYANKFQKKLVKAYFKKLDSLKVDNN